MGFTSPAQDYTERRLSLDEHCIKRPAATYLIKSGSGYPQVGIMPDSLLVVDSSRKPVDGSVVIADVEGEFRIFVLRLHPRPCLTDPATRRVVNVMGDDSCFDEGTEIFGVVTYAVNDTTTFEFDDVPI